MKFFNSKKEESVAKDISKRILAQQDRLTILHEVFSELPEGLVEWFKGRLNSLSASKGYVEVDLCQGVSVAKGVLPGDILIRKNRDPKVNDIVEISVRDGEGYFFQSVKVLKINIKEGTMFVQNLLEDDSKGSIAVSNVVYVVDKIIKFGTPEWKKIVELLDIDYDGDEVEEWIKNSIDYLKKNPFYDKENTLKKLDDRLKILKKK